MQKCCYIIRGEKLESKIIYIDRIVSQTQNQTSTLIISTAYQVCFKCKFAFDKIQVAKDIHKTNILLYYKCFQSSYKKKCFKSHFYNNMQS